MNKQLKKYGLLILVFLICICLNYNPQNYFETTYQHWNWNFSLMASILIILAMRFRDPTNWKLKLGINFIKKDYWGFLITLISLLILSYFLVDYVSTLSNYSFEPKLIYYKKYLPDFPFHSVLADYFYYIPQTFNEEMIIGALLLMGLERNFKKININIIAIGIALIFSLMHQSMYKWSPVQSGILLTIQSLLSLFFFGILRNILILKTRKITYSWAIHLCFNLIFFSGFFIKNGTDYFAIEPERFNIIFGNITMVILTGLLALASLMWLNLDRLKIICAKVTRL